MFSWYRLTVCFFFNLRISKGGFMFSWKRLTAPDSHRWVYWVVTARALSSSTAGTLHPGTAAPPRRVPVPHACSPRTTVVKTSRIPPLYNAKIIMEYHAYFHPNFLLALSLPGPKMF